MKEELKLLIKVMSNRDQFKWETSISHLVHRTPDFTADGDSSLYVAGGFSLFLKFWWYLDWPEDIKARNIREIKKDKSGRLISINVLEYANILLNFAASLVAIENLKKDELLQHEHPVALLRADNMSADSWTRKASSSSVTRKALMRLQCALLLNNL
eukprot:4671142-Ditylum_brightwellii.AAC.1